MRRANLRYAPAVAAVTSAVFIAAMLAGSALRLHKPLPYTPSAVLLVIAHPDDESMFFTPSLLTFVQQQVPVYVLCLSNGGAAGLGRVRERELYSACSLLQIPSAQVTVVDDPELQDGMQTRWPSGAVMQHTRHMLQHAPCDTVLTFDAQGVSGHVNHKGVHAGVRQLMAQEGQALGVRAAWQLVSDPLWLKFTGLLGVCWACLTARSHNALLLNPRPSAGIAAMRAHGSQWVWYRKLFVAFSTYTFANKLAPLL